jgi:hypothetical protein
MLGCYERFKRLFAVVSFVKLLLLGFEIFYKKYFFSSEKKYVGFQEKDQSELFLYTCDNLKSLSSSLEHQDI